jgi:hypothetical protein
VGPPAAESAARAGARAAAVIRDAMPSTDVGTSSPFTATSEMEGLPGWCSATTRTEARGLYPPEPDS